MSLVHPRTVYSVLSEAEVRGPQKRQDVLEFQDCPVPKSSLKTSYPLELLDFGVVGLLPDMASTMLDQPVPADEVLLSVLVSSTHSFLKPSPSLYTASLAVAKNYIDPLATATSEAQGQRQQLARRKRKRGDRDSYNDRSVLRLKQLHVDGFGINQIWEQARRALDASRLEVERSLRIIASRNETSYPKVFESALKKPGKLEKHGARFTGFNEDGLEVGSSEDDDVKGGEFEGADDDEEMADTDDIDSDEAKEVESEIEEEGVDEEDIGLGDEEPGGLSDSEDKLRDVYVPDKFGMNDGFFSIDDFNKQSDFLENQDARGEDDGAASDEDDVDWDADPLAKGAASKVKDDANNGGTKESEDEEDGPIFGNADLNGPDLSEDDHASDADLEMDDPGSMKNTNAIRYADFFEPPPRKLTKAGSRRRALPKTQPPPKSAEDQEEDLQRAMAAVRRDIFEDDLTPDEDEAPSDPEDRRSSHQKRQAAISAEIRRLEAAALQKRDWTLSGEARATDRPMNSLLEEDLDFERVGKPIPVITQEVSEDIEAMIKRRILARDFDEVIRRRPGNLATGGGKDGQRRGMFELSDTKPEQSLAEVYEAEHLQKTDPAAHPSKADQKLEQEHKKIEAMWTDVCAKLDALSSWHYRPKPPSADINVVADVPTISMEDARPAGAGGEVGSESMLAPQEIYKAGENRDKTKEVVTGGGMLVGREEMTREEKLRRRRREKERIRKSGEGVAPKKGEITRSGKKADEKRGVVKDLKKGGVRVIGRKGEIRDVEGNAVKGQTGSKGAGGYRL